MGLREWRILVRRALLEDRVHRDLTTRGLALERRTIHARIVVKEGCRVAGLPVVREVFRQIDRRVRLTPRVREGACLRRGAVMARLRGPAASILMGERVALNFLGHLCGVATLTRMFVERVRGTHAKIYDTRKTLPGLRALERYAVRVGGGYNHRKDLSDAVLIKDNHIAVVGGLKNLPPPHPTLSPRGEGKAARMQIEVRSLRELNQAILMGFRSLLLDNMSQLQLRQAVRIARKLAGRRVTLEASGGITLKNVRAAARTGVDRISVGRLTHSAPAIDMALKVTG